MAIGACLMYAYRNDKIPNSKVMPINSNKSNSTNNAGNNSTNPNNSPNHYIILDSNVPSNLNAQEALIFSSLAEISITMIHTEEQTKRNSETRNNRQLTSNAAKRNYVVIHR